MPGTFHFAYDLGSPYSYLASTRLEGLEQRTGAVARLVPVTLGGVRKSLGRELPSAPQLQYMARDVQRWAAQYGVPWTLPSSFPASTITALRCCVAAEQQGRQRDAMRALFAAYWVHGRDLSDAAVVRAALDEAGLDGAGLLERAGTQEIKDGLRKNTDWALSKGLFGVPLFIVEGADGDQLFWGNDRLQFVEAALRSQGGTR
jgi:2-hydroxychromene-2-carboxylate isomerase